uniref:Uncharacterized protein n=1 Tax=Ascaris lumbricoides TaxID=6252 RepID=A0A0M3HQZ8_ASCLU
MFNKLLTRLICEKFALTTENAVSFGIQIWDRHFLIIKR